MKQLSSGMHIWSAKYHCVLIDQCLLSLSEKYDEHNRAQFSHIVAHSTMNANFLFCLVPLCVGYAVLGQLLYHRTSFRCLPLTKFTLFLLDRVMGASKKPNACSTTSPAIRFPYFSYEAFYSVCRSIQQGPGRFDSCPSQRM